MRVSRGRSGILATVFVLAVSVGALWLYHAAPAAAADPVLVGAGDIAACRENGDEITARILDGIGGTVYTTGDNVYENGTLKEYRKCYGPSWGRHKARTRPVPGNHEYNSGGKGYYRYFGAKAGPSRRGYYSYDLGAWHVITLNSNVAAGTASAQYAWLRNDLTASDNPCTLAIWHHPVFSSGQHGNDPKMAAMYELLDARGADLALVGHDHDYERFAPQTSTGRADPNGMVQVVVGTGGRGFYPWGNIEANSVVRNNKTFGVFKMTLHPGSLDYEFVPQPGKTFTDSGTIGCGADST